MTLALVAFAAAACTSSEEPEIPEFPDLSELPLSEFSDQARAERVLPWADIEATCDGISNSEPISRFSTAGTITQQEPGPAANLSKYSSKVWESSRLLVESTSDPEMFRSIYILIAYLKEEGGAQPSLGDLEQFNYEITPSGTALVALSSQEVNRRGLVRGERSGTSIYIFDGLVTSSIIEVISADG